VFRSTGLPRSPRCRALSGWNAPRHPAHRSRLGAAAACVSTLSRSTPRPASRRRFALRLLVRHDARCVGPTSAFSRLRTSTRASSVPAASTALAPAQLGGIACFTAVRFASVGSTFSLGSSRRACCSRRDACVPNLWHPCRASLVVAPRSRGVRTRRSRRDRLTAHPRERCEQGRRSEMPSVLQGSLDPRRPFERPAPDLPCDAAWPPRARFSTPFHPPERPCELPSGPGSRPRAPLPTGVALLGVSAPLADFCNLFTTRGHTLSSRPILAREWSFRPATRRHQPMPVASASAVRCRTGGLRATTRTRRLACDAFRLRGRDEPRAEALEQRRSARSWTRLRVPFSWRFGHPGHRLDSTWRLEGLRASSHRPRPPSDAAPRRATPSKRSGCLPPHRNPYASGGLLLRARLDRGPFTPPPQRHCSGARAPF
jgi:hypothetical protein